MTWNEKELEIYDYWQMRSKDEAGVFMEGERKGLIKGLLEAIEGMLEIKYGSDGLALMGSIRSIEDIKRLEELKGLIKGSASVDELNGLI
ncbi:MAG: hypothetical protein HQL05_05220 [Nitrospirae bacterium]|nr:hypothetical protein [Nitrospirota bacterium]